MFQLILNKCYYIHVRSWGCKFMGKVHPWKPHWSPTNNGDSLHSNRLSNDQRLTIKKRNFAGFSLSWKKKKRNLYLGCKQCIYKFIGPQLSYYKRFFDLWRNNIVLEQNIIMWWIFLMFIYHLRPWSLYFGYHFSAICALLHKSLTTIKLGFFSRI